MLQADPFAFLLILVAGGCFWAFYRVISSHFASPFWSHSSTAFLKAFEEPAYVKNWGRRFQWMALACFAIAFLDFHWEAELPQQDQSPIAPVAAKGLALYLVIDQSGSMAEKRGTESKINLTKEMTQEFVNHRPNDLIGLISFARAARVLSPLTLDHDTILNELKQLQVVPSQSEDGTAIGYAIFKTANLIAATKRFAQDLLQKGKPAYEIQNAIIVMVTDGVPDPNPLDAGKQWRNIDVETAAEYAKDQGIRLYVINIDPRFAAPEFAPHRRILEKSVQATGGKLFMVDSKKGLQRVYEEIEALEKQQLPLVELEGVKNKQKKPPIVRMLSLYPWLIGIGIFFLLASFALDTFWVRRSP